MTEIERATVLAERGVCFPAVQLKFESADLMVAEASHHVRGGRGTVLSGHPGPPLRGHEKEKWKSHGAEERNSCRVTAGIS